MKTQAIRLLDIFAYGPFILYAATKQKDELLKLGFLVIGISTIVYNAANYLEVAKGEEI